MLISWHPHVQMRAARDFHLERLASADTAIERLLIQKAKEEAVVQAELAKAAEEE